jgi:uncharacterized membrane protein
MVLLPKEELNSGANTNQGLNIAPKSSPMAQMPAQIRAQELNLTRFDRIGCVLGGIALVVWGLRRPGWVRGGAAGVGGWLLYQAYTGSNPLLRPLGIQVNPRPREALAHETIVVEDALTIARPRAEVFEYWRSAAHLPCVLESETEIAGEDAGVAVAWRGMRQGKLAHFGSIELRDGPGGVTHVRAHLEYAPSGGSLGAALSCMTRHSPQRVLADTLRCARAVLETGETSKS